MHIHWGAFKSFYIFVHIRDSIGLVSAIAKQQAINKSAIQHDVIVHFGFPGNTASDFLCILCLLYVGGSQSSSDANNHAGAANTTVPRRTSGWKSLPWKI